jgi:hypothetical protein
MNVLDKVAARMRRFSVRLLSTAILFEIAGASAILLFWPRLWPLGVLLIAVASTRLWSLALRFRETSSGPVETLYVAIQWGSLASAALALLFLVFGLFALVLGTAWT